MRVLDASLSLKRKLGWTWKQTPKLRKKSPRLSASIQTAEERILLSGVTAVSDALVINQAATAAENNASSSDSEATSAGRYGSPLAFGGQSELAPSLDDAVGNAMVVSSNHGVAAQSSTSVNNASSSLTSAAQSQLLGSGSSSWDASADSGIPATNYGDGESSYDSGYDNYAYGDYSSDGYGYDAGNSGTGSSLDGSGSDSDSSATDGIGIPQVSIPDLEVGRASTLNQYSLPSQTSTSTLETSGSFTEDALTNPDFDAEGINWVHRVDTNWVSENQWSVTERFVLVFNVGDSASDGDSFADTEAIDGYDVSVAGSWASQISVSRNGFLTLTFTASLGVTTDAAAGVAWSLETNYSDTITIIYAIAGQSAVSVTPSAPSTSQGSYDGEYVDEQSSSGDQSISAFSSFSAGVGVTFFSKGDSFASSTPAIVNGVVERDVVARGSYRIGMAEAATSSWTEAIQSGNLSLAAGSPLAGLGSSSGDGLGGHSNPLPEGGDLGLSYDAAAPQIDASDPENGQGFNPMGSFEGDGLAMVASGSSTVSAGVTAYGSFHASGKVGGRPVGWSCCHYH